MLKENSTKRKTNKRIARISQSKRKIYILQFSSMFSLLKVCFDLNINLKLFSKLFKNFFLQMEISVEKYLVISFEIKSVRGTMLVFRWRTYALSTRNEEISGQSDTTLVCRWRHVGLTALFHSSQAAILILASRIQITSFSSYGTIFTPRYFMHFQRVLTSNLIINKHDLFFSFFFLTRNSIFSATEFERNSRLLNTPRRLRRLTRSNRLETTFVRLPMCTYFPHARVNFTRACNNIP